MYRIDVILHNYYIRIAIIFFCTGNCVNKQSKNNCNRWMRRGYCAKENKYRKYMQKNCCNTCRSAGMVLIILTI